MKLKHPTVQLRRNFGVRTLTAESASANEEGASNTAASTELQAGGSKEPSSPEIISHSEPSTSSDCDILIMGCGDDKITLWNVEHGYVVATIDLMVTKQQPRILWAKCDRGFLFTLHHFDDGLLSLIAINSFDSTWKKLQIYKPALEHDNLHGVCMENGLVVAFYDTGVLCWKAETGELIVEDSYEDSVFLPFGKYVVVVLKNQVHVRHALEYLVTIEDS